MDDREDDRSEQRGGKRFHIESLDESAEHPEEESIDDKREDTEGQEIDRQGQLYR